MLTHDKYTAWNSQIPFIPPNSLDSGFGPWLVAVCTLVSVVFTYKRWHSITTQMSMVSVMATPHPPPTPLPRLIALDLDATVWYPEMYMLWGGGSPFDCNPDGSLSDRKGVRLELMGNAKNILYEVKTRPEWSNTLLAYCSCTDEPNWAEECMQKIEVGDGYTVKTVCDHFEIYKGGKKKHFMHLNEVTGIPYEDMLFFDNEQQNCYEVEQLGVTCIHCPYGLTQDIWEDGLKQHAELRDWA